MRPTQQHLNAVTAVSNFYKDGAWTNVGRHFIYISALFSIQVHYLYSTIWSNWFVSNMYIVVLCFCPVIDKLPTSTSSTSILINLYFCSYADGNERANKRMFWCRQRRRINLANPSSRLNRISSQNWNQYSGSNNYSRAIEPVEDNSSIALSSTLRLINPIAILPSLVHIIVEIMSTITPPQAKAISILCANNLHQSLWLPETAGHPRLRVSYSTTSNFSDTSLPAVLFVGPLFGSRWFILEFDKVARESGVRMVWPDR